MSLSLCLHLCLALSLFVSVSLSLPFVFLRLPLSFISPLPLSFSLPRSISPSPSLPPSLSLSLPPSLPPVSSSPFPRSLTFHSVYVCLKNIKLHCGMERKDLFQRIKEKKEGRPFMPGSPHCLSFLLLALRYTVLSPAEHTLALRIKETTLSFFPSSDLGLC